jgi:CMP-N,N'-diacetyllegionaminic acid synthase
MKIFAFVPARSGSSRIKNKNIKYLNKHPLLAYTIAQAAASGIFEKIIISTDSKEIAAVAKEYGGEIFGLRPSQLATCSSPDIGWILHLMQQLKEKSAIPDAFCILRPTSPFRDPKTIQNAWETFRNTPFVDSLRAVEKCTQHPGKMWVIRGDRLLPLLPFGSPPWHSSPYQNLPEIYTQNASLEIAWSRVPIEDGTIAGNTVMPWISEGYDGFDINNPVDWEIAESICLSYEFNQKIMNYLSSHANS